MARRNAQAGAIPLGKFAPKAHEMPVCALHKLPIEERKGKKMVRAAGQVQLVDATYYVCPAGCCDPHVEIDGDKTVPVLGLTAWKRSLPIDDAKANLAEFKKDKAAYLSKMVPVPRPRQQVRFVPEKIVAEAPAKKADKGEK